jgi:poly(hydroxyalkanoate) granule-associated protein
MATKTKTTMIDDVKKVGDDVRKAGRSMWLAGLGVVAYADEEARSLFDKLVDKGTTFEQSERNVVARRMDDMTEKAREMGGKVGERVQGTVQGVMHRAGVPTSDEIQTLIQRVETLTSKVEKMQQAAH